MKVRYGKSDYWSFSMGIGDGGFVGLFKVRIGIVFWKYYLEVVFGEDKSLKRHHL